LIAPAASVSFVASASPDTASALEIAPGSLPLAPTQSATVTVTARDRFGNPAPAAPVTVYLGSPIRGALESLGATSGGPGSQSGITDGSGDLAVRYRAPSVAPAVDSIFARGPTIGPAGIEASTSPGATAALRVSADSLTWTAGIAERVRVQAVDAFGNVVLADGATVTMRPSGSLAWGPASGALVSGEFFTFARDTVAESVLLGADRAGGGSGSGGTAVVAPALPAGLIPIAATRDSLTADTRSAATVTLGPVRDAYGNLVAPGTLIGVAAQAGTLLASDASTAYPGLDLATGADGTATVLLVAPAVPGPDTLLAATRVGSAVGSHPFTYVPPPSIAYVSGSLAPGAVLPNGSASFTLSLSNTGSGPIRIETPSALSFGAGSTVFTANVAPVVTVGPGATETVALAAATVSAALTPGVYAPSFRAIGTDGTGAAFDFYPSLAGAQVTVLGLDVAAVSASPDPAPLGYATLALVFDVANPAGISASVTGLSLSYSAGAFVLSGGPAPAIPATISAGGTTRFTLPVQVPSSGLASGTVVQARLHATADFSGTAVVDSNAVALSFRVVSAARIASVAGTGAPARLLRARTAGPGVRVENTGSSAVTLLRGTTRLVFDRGATVLAAGLSANAIVAASDRVDLKFDSLAVPPGTPKGRYRARIFLDGTESGQAFADTIDFAPDSLDVVDPAILAVLAGSLAPDTVSAGQDRPLSLSLRNSGDVPFALDAGTALDLGPPVGVSLAIGAAAAVQPGQTLPLSFAGGALGAAATPGAAAATLEATGFEDGVPRAESLPAGTLYAEPPAALVYVARSTAPRETRPGATVDVTLDLRNGGGSPFVLDPAASRLTVSDGVDVMTALASGAPVSLGPGAQATLSFPGVSVPAGMASQPYRVDLVLHGSEWGMADSVAAASPDSEFTVLEPLGALQVRAFDASAPVQVSPGSTPVRAWGLELTPLTPPGGATRDSLRTIALTVLADGSAGLPPASTIASIALRDRAGATVAQAAPAAANPVPLALTPPLLMTGAPESLVIEITLAAGAAGAASRVALRLGQATDVVAVDALTQVPVSVVGGGGLPFAPLTSPEITLFERAHGYPNPFHAGRDAVRLSYVLAQDSPVRVAIYTLLGDLVREISLPAGSAGGAAGLNEVPWDGRNGSGEIVRPGVYVARIEGSGARVEIKVGVLR
ncbi:MAG: LEA type 2 family protein, partial [Candidatus Latescibacteria bacterium]|nr:LEA type 2 family protein [Candidatus Latescibacterota bacterium]